MSRDFFLYCATCRVAGPGQGGDCNWQQAGFLALIPHMPLFAQVGRAGFEIDRESLGILGNRLGGVSSFAEQHDGHKIVVADEYGEVWGECSKRITCLSCGNEDKRCRRAADHDGPCSPDELEVPGVG